MLSIVEHNDDDNPTILILNFVTENDSLNLDALLLRKPSVVKVCIGDHHDARIVLHRLARAIIKSSPHHVTAIHVDGGQISDLGHLAVAMESAEAGGSQQQHQLVAFEFHNALSSLLPPRHSA